MEVSILGVVERPMTEITQQSIALWILLMLLLLLPWVLE
jgi:hypothetical protein